MLRRPPVLLLLQKLLWQVNGAPQSLFVGFFGPIGVSAIFYQHVALEFLRTEVESGEGMRGDVEVLSEVVRVVVWFVVLCSIVSLPIPLSSRWAQQ